VLLLIGVLFVTIALLAAAPAAHAGLTGTSTYTWTGAVSSTWSDPGNWEPNGVPANGDSLVFPNTDRDATVNDLVGLTLQNVTFRSIETISVTGNALTLAGDLTMPEDLATVDWDVDTVLSAGPHTLSSAGQEMRVSGDLSGGAADQTLTIGPGSGAIKLGGQNGFSSPIEVTGCLGMDSEQGLSNVAVSLVPGGRLMFGSHMGDAWNVGNSVSGDAGALVSFEEGAYVLSGSWTDFTGTATLEATRSRVTVPSWVTVNGVVVNHGMLRGSGQIAALDSEGLVWPIGPMTLVLPCYVNPGNEDYEVATLAVAGDATLGLATHLTVDFIDGSSNGGHDLLTATSVDVPVDPETSSLSGGEVTIALRSPTSAQLYGFDPYQAYRWSVVRASDALTVDDYSRLVVDASQFDGGDAPGTFSVEPSADGKAIDVVYTPPESRRWDGGAGWEHPEWSNPLNWEGDTLPSDGDNLYFPEYSNAVNDDFLTSVGAVYEDMSSNVSGSAVTLAGPMQFNAQDDWGTGWYAPSTLTRDTTIGLLPASNPTGAPAAIGNVSLEDDGGVGHSLTVNTAGESRAEFYGDITGDQSSCALIKKGTGRMVLQDGGWTTGNTWAGPTDVLAGTLSINSPGALSSHTDVHIAEGAALAAALWDWSGPVADTWSNTFSGEGSLRVDYGTLTLTAASESFTGTAECYGTLVQTGSFPAAVACHGVLRGTGIVGPVEVDTGTLGAGTHEYESGELSVSGAATLHEGSSYACDVSDADGAAGTGHDLVDVDAGVILAGTSPSPVAVVLRSGADGVEGPAAGFAGGRSYRWPVVLSGGEIEGLTEDTVKLQTAAFTAQNPSADGAFTLEVTDHGTEPDTYQTLDVVYTPSFAIISGPVVGDGGNEFAKGSEQTVAWEMDSAPPAGSVFKVVADDPASGTDELLATVPATSATAYSYDWTIAQGPSEGWHVTVQLWSDEGESAVQYCAADSQTFDILPAEYTIQSFAMASGAYLGQWGLPMGSGDGELRYPSGVAVAPNGDVYVVDQINRRIQYFSATGVYKGQWGSLGSGPGAFELPWDVAIAPNGDVYVTDAGSHRVQYFTATGAYKGIWGTQGSGPGQMAYPLGIEVASNGDVYVADSGNHRVQYYGATGDYKGAWGSDGDGDGQFRYPSFIAVAPSGDVYVSDDGNDRVQYFTATGVYKGQWGGGSGELQRPQGIAVSLDGDVFVADVINDCVRQYGRTGVPKGQWGIRGSGDGQFYAPMGIGMAQDGRVYVADQGNTRIQYFGTPGTISPCGVVTAASGSTPTFTLTPDEGCHITTVQVDGVPVTPTPTGEYTFAPVTADHTISVQFAVDQFTITPSTVGSGHGAISPAVPQTVDYGATPIFAFTPDSGYVIKQVRVDGEPVAMTGTAYYMFAPVKADHAISVEFALKKYEISVTAGTHGKIEPGTGEVEHGSSPTYVITPDEGYHIADVLADGQPVGAVPSVTFENVDRSHTLSATFAVDTFTITPSVVGGAGGHGTISPSTPQTVDRLGTPTFTFTPQRGCEVDVVRVDGQPVAMTGTNEYTFPAVTGDHAISVSFKPLTYEITVTAGEHGSVTPGSGPAAWGSTPEYAITPDEGFAVADVLVDGASVGAVTSYRFAAVTTGHTLAASFVAEGMPWAGVEGASSRWSKRPVRLAFNGHPGEGGVPVAYTEYKLGDGDWVRGSSVTVSAEGETEVFYRAVDTAGIAQDPAGHCLVRVDTKRPCVVARPASARRGVVARLQYVVKDPTPSSGRALVRAVVTRLGGGRALTRASSLPVTVNQWHTLRIKTGSLSPGAYLVTLRAMDKAGNFQRGVTHVRLTIL
jgi:hypothetical protein